MRRINELVTQYIAVMRTLQILLLLCLSLGLIGCAAAAPASGGRARRQIDLTVSADHDDKADETELALEAIAGLWSSADNRTKIDGSAKVVHRASGMQTGTLQDWRLGVRVQFS